MNQVQETNRQFYRDKLVCSKCQYELEIKSQKEISVFVCPSCNHIDASKINKDYSKINVSVPNKGQILQLKQKGVYHGRSFQIIGVSYKREDSMHNIYWWEYTLQYDDDGSIFYLSVWNGHFTFYEKLVGELPAFDKKKMKQAILFQNDLYEYYFHYGYKTEYAQGGFPYDVVDVRSVKIYEYMHPPYLISLEFDNVGELTCFKSTYVFSEEVAKIFNNPSLKYVEKSGIAPAQPFYGGINMKTFNFIGLSFLVLFTIASIAFFGYWTNRTLVYETLTFEDGQGKIEYVSPSFTLRDKSTPYFLNFQGQSNVSNDWVEIQFSLINEKTGTEKELSLGIEYYSGVDNGYSWSEGSTSNNAYLSGVESGRYHLKVTAIKPASNLEANAYIKLETDSPWGWNYRAVVIPFGLLLIIMNIIHRQFNRVKLGEIDTLFGG